MADALTPGLALTSAGAGIIHLSTAGEHEALFGVAFLVMAAFQLAWAALVFLRPGALAFATGLAGHGAIVATWFTTRTSGLPFGPGAGQPEGVGFKDGAATVLELMVIAGALVALRPGGLARLRSYPLPRGFVALPAVALTALIAAAVMSPHAHGPHGNGQLADGHSHAEVADNDDSGSATHDHNENGGPNSRHEADAVSASGEHGSRAPGAQSMSSGHAQEGNPHRRGDNRPRGSGDGHGNEPGSGQGNDHEPDHGAHVEAAGGPFPYTWLWDPAEVEIEAGAMVEWINRTEVDHHVTFYEGPTRKSLHLEIGGRTSVVFSEPGTYLYRCDISGHSEMASGRCVGQCGAVSVIR